jgi:Tol biopolymer transport system component
MDIDCGTDAGGNGCNCRSPAADQLILWGFDKVFLGTLEEGRFRGWRLKLTPLPVNPPVKNLIASSAAAGRLALVGLKHDTREWAIFVVSMPSGRVEATVSREALTVALAPDGQRLAFTAPTQKPATGASLLMTDVEGAAIRVLVREQVGSTFHLSWHPSGETLAFDGPDGWIWSVRIADGQTDRLVEGQPPQWAPDGRRLTFRRGPAAYIWDKGPVRLLHTRRFWQSNLGGAPAWSPRGDVVTWNGLNGYEFECLLIEAASGTTWSVYKGSYWCGPWLQLPATRP